MDCRSFRANLTANDPEAASEALLRHRATCARCDREARAAVLLRLGSSLDTQQPGPDFEAGLRARLAGAGRNASTTSWADGIGLVARPALGLAAVVLFAVLAWSGWSYTSLPADDIDLLAGGDATLDSLPYGMDGFDAESNP